MKKQTIRRWLFKLKGYFPIQADDLAVMIGLGCFTGSLAEVLYKAVLDEHLPHGLSLIIAGIGFLAGRLINMAAQSASSRRSRGRQPQE